MTDKQWRELLIRSNNLSKMLAEQQRAEFCDLAKEISKTRYLTNRNVLNLDLREKTDAFGWQMAGHIAYQIINRLKRNITP